MKHTCHWDGCEVSVPPKMWGCKIHWFTLPKFLRDAIWKAYRPGQEVRKDPSDQYVVVALMAEEWIAAFKAGKKLNEREFLDLIYANRYAIAARGAGIVKSSAGEA